MPAEPFRKTAHSLLLFTVVASSFLSLGCRGNHWAAMDPWRRQEWEEDENYGHTIQDRLREVRNIRTDIKLYEPNQREHLIGQLATLYEGKSEKQPNKLLREEVVRTLGEFQEPSALAVLDKAIHDDDMGVRQVACQSLGSRGDLAALRSLALVIEKDDNQDVRLTAARELSKFKHPEAVQALGVALDDRDPALKYRAIQSLRSAGTVDHGNDIAAWKAYVKQSVPSPATTPAPQSEIATYPETNWNR